jgi:hypothetical protein
MKFQWVILAIAFVSCGGSLSSEQRKRMRENMEAKSLKKISDAELTEAALGYGRKIAWIIESRSGNQKFLDSLETVYNVEILFMQPNDSGLRAVEKQIVEAYSSEKNGSNLSDNIQKMGSDSLLYTKPIGKERPDGSLAFTKVLGLRLPKKPIILSIKRKD